MSAQKPLELILARNLLSSISTPAFLVGEQGALLFYNEAAGALVGRRFEETGVMSAQQWTSEFGPFGDDEQPMPYDDIPATIALRDSRPYHGNFRICAAGGRHQDIAASAIPIVGAAGSTGAIVIFWPLSEGEPCNGEGHRADSDEHLAMGENRRSDVTNEGASQEVK